MEKLKRELKKVNWYRIDTLLGIAICIFLFAESVFLVSECNISNLKEIILAFSAGMCYAFALVALDKLMIRLLHKKIKE